ncbi:metallophosphoesterase family protein [Acuticoccus sp.]|uniref:metallophosphoesterase family protein n=1 Tax=Acuticoccus sp. TaxID=1904378 RepID=UPI003B52A9FD
MLKTRAVRLLAISDLHLSSAVNRDALSALPAFPRDWLIVAGDVAERLGTVARAFATLAERFARVIWVPGNHDLWAIAEDGGVPLAGQARYEALVALAREHGVLTPEDPYVEWPGAGDPVTIAPLFVLYDYSFRPAHVAREEVVGWARAGRAVCADELYLDPAPFASREAWCAARLASTRRRLDALPRGRRTVLVNHFPLRADLVRIPRVPRFAPWCGTRQTEDWHLRYDALAVVSGHLHVRRTDWRDGTRFEEVSLGYPRQWNQALGMAHYLRQILPHPGREARATRPSSGAGSRAT